MRIFENRSIFKKVLIVLLCVIIVSFCVPKNVQAKDEGIGGKLLNPVIDLLIGLGDGAMNVIHTVIYHQNDTLLTVDMSNSILAFLATIAVFIVVAVVVAAAVVFTAGLATAALATIGVSLSAIGVGTVLIVSVTSGVVGAAVFNSNVLPDNLQLPVYSISPEEIFSNEILLFDVDFFNPQENKTLEDGTEMESTAKQLRSILSSGYTTLRDISLVALLSVLVYIGIRILISSTSSDKAKYKQMLLDWIVAICLLFVMQYIMAFSNLLVGKVTELVRDVKYDNGYVAVIEDKDGKIETALSDGGYDISSLKYQEEGKNFIQWKTNLLGISRLNAQMAKDTSTSYAGYALIFIVLVLFTMYFIFTYLKRLLYMAFLTLIAPMVALTYPIDKMNDGKAQAFNSWLKEYIFNLLIQPMHLLLYSILISAAFELASTNIIYSLVAIGFMIPAEKLLRRFFGFEKAHTPGLLAGPAGAAVMMSGINKLLGRRPKGGKGSNNGVKPKIVDGNGNDTNIKYKSLDDDSFFNGKIEENEIANLEEPNSLGRNNINQALYSEKSDLSRGSNNNQKLNSGETKFNDKYDIPIEDRINNGINGFKDGVGALSGGIKDEFNKTSLGQNLNKANRGVKQGTRKIKNGVSNSRIGRTIKNSRTVQAGKAGIKYYGNGLRSKIENKLNNSHPLKSVPKVAAGIAGGVAAGTIGLAAGISSGDINKTVQYTTGAALGGYTFGGAVGNKTVGTLLVDGVEDEISKAYYGDDEYNQRLRDKETKKIVSDYKNKEKILKHFDGDKARTQDFIDNHAADYVDYGITDIKDMLATHSLVESGIDKNRAISVATSVNEYGKRTDKLGAKDSEDLNKTLLMRAKKNSRLKTDKERNQIADQTRELMDKYSKIKFKK